MFKLLFAAEKNRDVLIMLLTAILEPKSPFTSAHVLNPEVEREKWDDKGTVLDIHVPNPGDADPPTLGVE